MNYPRLRRSPRPLLRVGHGVSITNRYKCGVPRYGCNARKHDRHSLRCHALAGRGIRYAVAYRLNYNRLEVLDRPLEPGDDTGVRNAITAPIASDRNRTAPRRSDRPATSAKRSHPTFG
ncbi:hypothetical protein F8237_07945 [Bradyrhizobium betae]|uniref:Uncharacterized protein n=1 Tax=Bradyrhizobium betae TaxID=244734 RepID=A0A5P6P1V1_9BRAD|nr:hypothetical protein F8237_07945 [Bradyrhizobium betae]